MSLSYFNDPTNGFKVVTFAEKLNRKEAGGSLFAVKKALRTLHTIQLLAVVGNNGPPQTESVL